MKEILLLIFTITIITGCTSKEEAQDWKRDGVTEQQNHTTSNLTNINSDLDENNHSFNSNKRISESENNTGFKGDEVIVLDVPIINQKPELPYGCEVTSLAMVLNYAGVEVTKLELADNVLKESDPVKQTEQGDITDWGDPGQGFVGDMTGKGKGYAVFDRPVEKLMIDYLGDSTLNLTNKDFNELLKQVYFKKPVVVWTTGDYHLPDRWEEWNHEGKIIKTPLDLHAVVLVGYEKDYVYLNDPLSGQKKVKVDKEQFIKSWEALEKRAISYK